MLELNLYNTRTRQKEKFCPINSAYVRLYVCGPTVYDDIHIGNARPLIIFDILFRLLRHSYGAQHVFYVRNITDVDDKINKRAALLYPGDPIHEAIDKLTQQTIKSFEKACQVLRCLPPTHEPRARAHIEKMKDIIEVLLEKGIAYIEDDHVLFSVSKVKAPLKYGALSNRKLEELRAGSRVAVESYKQDPMDFVLWKPAKEGEPGWPSPGGISVLGRPGWHIECSAMSMAKLLEPFGGGLSGSCVDANVFDIHGGGIDLLFPHHENEVAQSCAALNTEKMANFWMHNGHLMVEGQKMSKSLGNFITIASMLAGAEKNESGFTPEQGHALLGCALRLSMLQTHYREPINWTKERLSQSQEEILKWHAFIEKSQQEAQGEENSISSVSEEFIACLADDLNTPKAVTLLRHFFKKKQFQPLKASLAFLGLLDKNLYSNTNQSNAPDALESSVQEAIALRDHYIALKDWQKADAIRDALLKKGWVLQDIKDSTTGARKTQVSRKA